MSLIHWWPLDGDLKDKIGGNHLSYMTPAENSINFIPTGKLGFAAQRTIANKKDYLRSKNTIKICNTPSIAAWVYVDELASLTSANGLITNHNHSKCSGFGLTLRAGDANTAYLSFNAGDGVNRVFHSYYGTTNIMKAWHHLCCTYDGTNVRIYVDGKCEKIQEYKNMYFTEEYLDIFSWSVNYSGDTQYRPACKICDVRFYDHPISHAEVQDLYKALIIHYTFDDKLCNTHSKYLINEAGFRNPLTAELASNPIYNNPVAVGTGSMHCEGTTKIEMVRDGENNAPATASMWINVGSSYPASNQVVFVDYNSKLAFGFYGSQNAIISCSNYHQPQITNIKSLWKTGWNHVVIRRNNNDTIQCFLNAVLLPSETTTNFWTHNTTTMIIGCRNNGTYSAHFTGFIDDFRFYASALSDQEIKELYNCGGRISDRGGVLAGSFIESATATKVNKNHTITTKEIYEDLLPNGYQQLEWIETDGQAYINTGYNSSLPYLIDCDMEITGSALGNYWFGQQQNSSRMLYNGFYNDTSLEFNWRSVLSSGTRKIMTQMLINNTQANITINGISTIRDIGTNGQGGDLYIFACRAPDNSFRPYNSRMKLYSFKIHEGNTYIRNFLPARHISDGAIGLYDIINNQFYTNAGSGSFTAGPTITTGQASLLHEGGLTAEQIIEI